MKQQTHNFKAPVFDAVAESPHADYDFSTIEWDWLDGTTDDVGWGLNGLLEMIQQAAEDGFKEDADAYMTVFDLITKELMRSKQG